MIYLAMSFNISILGDIFKTEERIYMDSRPFVPPKVTKLKNFSYYRRNLADNSYFYILKARISICL